MIPNPYPGAFFVVEGIDGSGKSAQAQIIQKWLATLPRLLVNMTKEPNKNEMYGRLIYEELNKPNGLHRTDPFGFQRWYACNSRINIQDNVILVLGNSSGVVVSDRYRPSIVYGAQNISDVKELMRITEAIIGHIFFWPDAIFILDVRTEVAIGRLKKKGRPMDEYENGRKLLGTASLYRQLPRIYPNCHLIPSGGTEEEIFAQIRPIMEAVLIKKGLLQLVSDVKEGEVI